MAIKFSCPHCKRALNVKNELAGKRGPCPGCKKIIAIPSAAPGTPAPRPAAPPQPKMTFEDLERAAAAAFAEPAPAPKQETTKTIEFPCPHCDTKVTVTADLEGKQTPCSNPECRRIIKVPLQKKQQPLDWRKNPAQGLPSLAKRDAPAEPEGAWGNVTRSAQVSKEALSEAGVIIEETERTPLRTWITRGVLLSLFLIVAAGAAWWGMSALSASKQSDLVKLAMSCVDSEKPKLGGNYDAAVFMAASEYALGSRTKDSAKEARNHLRCARSFLVQQPPSLDRDCLLIDVALLQVELGGDADEIAHGIRLTWDAVQLELMATIPHLGRFGGSASTVPYGPRAEALRLLCRKLLDRKQVQVAYSLAAMVGNEPLRVPIVQEGEPNRKSLPAEVPEALGIAGLEFLRAGEKSQAEQLAQKALGLTHVPKQGAAPEPDKPAITDAPAALALALALDIKQVKDLKPSDDAPADARQFDALLAKAEAGDPIPALKFAANDLGLSPWQLLRLARVAAPSHAVEVQEIAGGARDEDQKAWMQFEVFAARLPNSDPVPSLADSTPEDTTARARARLLVVRRAAQQGKDLKGAVDSWSDTLKPFGYMGMALGMQDREHK